MSADRKTKILQMLETDGLVKVNDLVKIFDVSRETIRRDLEFLEKDGKISRVHGGAVARRMFGVEPDFSEREMKNHAEKVAIGRMAADLVNDGETIVIDTGATTLTFAQQLIGRRKHLTVLTNSILIGTLLADQPGFRVILLGGDIKGGEFSTHGFLSEDNMRMFNVDKYISGVCGLTLERGISNYHIEESNLQRNMIAQAPYIIALADFSKLGTTCLNYVCDIKDIDVLVTDTKADKRILSKVKELGVEVYVADPVKERGGMNV